MRRIRKHGKTTEKKQTESWQEAESRMERSGCVMWKKYYGSDTNITKAVDRVSFLRPKRRICGNHGSIGFRKDNTFEYAVYD